MNWSTDYTELPIPNRKPMTKRLNPISSNHFTKLIAKAKKRKLTAARYAHISSMPYATCWRILDGKVTRPTLDQVVSLANALDMDVQIKVVPR